MNDLTTDFMSDVKGPVIKSMLALSLAEEDAPLIG